jgi:hypothetical protein
MNFAAIGKAAAGNMHWQYVYKASTPAAGTAGFFIDLNQSSGQPKYNPFAGTSLALTPLTGEGNLGVYPGVFEAGKTKNLLRWQMQTSTTPPDFVYLCDYLAFYPLIDADDPDTQTMDNSQSLPRYSSGQIVLIVQAPLASTAPVTITYLNQDGVSRSSTYNIIAGAAIGTCATGTGTVSGAGQATPFFPLAANDTGVQSITSVQFGASGGGFICAAIVKPLATLQLYEAGVATEKQFGLNNSLPEIKPGACLNFLIQRGGTAAAAYQSELLFVNA